MDVSGKLFTVCILFHKDRLIPALEQMAHALDLPIPRIYAQCLPKAGKTPKKGVKRGEGGKSEGRFGEEERGLKIECTGIPQ